METGEAVFAVLDAMEQALTEEESSLVIASLSEKVTGTVAIVKGSRSAGGSRLNPAELSSLEDLPILYERPSVTLSSQISLVSGEAFDLPNLVCMPIKPPPSVTIFGAGDDAQPLVRFAAELGWRVTVSTGEVTYSPRSDFLRRIPCTCFLTL